MYFNQMQDIFYLFNINGRKELLHVKDITQNVRFRKEIIESISIYDFYDIKDGETPEILADRLYNNSQYHWVLMILNERYNIATDWPMAQDILEDYIWQKYKVEVNGVVNDQATRAAINAIHHWEDSKGHIVMPDTYEATSVTNYEYEVRLNDKKRRIKIISNDILANIIAQYKLIM